MAQLATNRVISSGVKKAPRSLRRAGVSFGWRGRTEVNLHILWSTWMSERIHPDAPRPRHEPWGNRSSWTCSILVLSTHYRGSTPEGGRRIAGSLYRAVHLSRRIYDVHIERACLQKLRIPRATPREHGRDGQVGRSATPLAYCSNFRLCCLTVAPKASYCTRKKLLNFSGVIPYPSNPC